MVLLDVISLMSKDKERKEEQVKDGDTTQEQVVSLKEAALVDYDK